MTTIEIRDVADEAPLTHHEALDLQAAELERDVALLRDLTADQWTAQTDCPDWDVRRMWLHVLGACEAGASMRENAHQMLAGRRFQKANGGPLEAALSATQVAERIDLTPEQLVERLAAVAPTAVRGRRRIPAPMRAVKVAVDGPVVERWRLGYLLGTIYLRDLWMHRVDTCRALGVAMDLSAEHDGRIVADVVAEWARRHGEPFTLELTGPAGGAFAVGAGGPSIVLDAVDLCRTLAGRADGDGLLATIVPF